jgi:formylglycine-generating enzyme required for sulfatase activity
MSRLFAVVFALLVSCASAGTAEQVVQINSLGQTLVLLEGGRFVRGSDAGEDGLARAFPLHIHAQFLGNPERPAHITWITRPFWMGKSEVTVGQWKAFVAATGYVTTAEQADGEMVGWSPTPADKPLYESHDFIRSGEFTWKNPGFPQSDNDPVVGVSWTDTQAFLKWLSETEKASYRLPTEAEWEYACRAGTTTWFSFGDEPLGSVERFANLAHVELEKFRKHATERQWLLPWDVEKGDGHIFTAPVASMAANAFGLHDLHGNVWEWCQDLWLDTHYQHWKSESRHALRPIAVDPLNHDEPLPGPNRFHSIRGGSWANGPIVARSSHEREVKALATVEGVTGILTSDDGITRQLRFAGETIPSEAFAALRDIPGLISLSLAPEKPFTLSTEDVTAIVAATTIRTLDFRSSITVAPEDLALLMTLPELASLSFSRTSSLTDAHLLAVGKGSSLTEFRCFGKEGGALTDVGLRQLASHRGLVVLEVEEAAATGEFMSVLGDAPLETFTLTKPYNGPPLLTDAMAAQLSQFTRLRRLRLNQQGMIGDPTLLCLARLTNLEELGLQGCGGSDFTPLSALVKLRTLNLQGTSVGDSAVAALRSIPRLQSLRLGSEGLTDAGLAHLGEIVSLESLYIETCSATDAALAHLARINRLNSLDMGGPRITGRGLGALAVLPDLNDLRLRCPSLVDAALSELATIKSLRKLRLVERGWQPPAALTDAGILTLAPATWLKELWLPRNDTALTEAGIAALQTLMPDTGVIPYTVEWKQ